MALPARLAPGLLSIYGLGDTGVADITLPSGDVLTFGVVDQIWDNFPKIADQWDSVMFSEKDIIASLVYNDIRYVLVHEDNILLVEIPPP